MSSGGTGCSTVVVRRSLVIDDKLTVRGELCVLIDKTIRRTTVAEIYVDTPYYTGTKSDLRSDYREHRGHRMSKPVTANDPHCPDKKPDQSVERT